MSVAQNLSLTTKNIVLQFDAIKENDFPFKRASLGSTGITYISRKVGFDWVVKWQSPALAEAEYLSTVFYRKNFNSLSTPFVLYHLDPKLLEKIRKIFRKEDILPTYVPLVMEYMQGVTLHSLYKESHIFQLRKDELISLFRRLGEVAGYDFIIANFDRLSPVEFTGELNGKYSTNSGNLLVEFEDGPLDKEKRVRRVHVIDNAPHLYNFFIPDERKGIVLSKDNSPLRFDLFDDSTEGEVGEKKPKQLSVAPSAPSKTGTELREARHAEFRRFLEADNQLIQLLAQQIFLGAQNEWRQIIAAHKLEGVHLFDDWKVELERNLAEGLLVAQQRLKTLSVECIGDLEQELMTTNAAKITIEFIKLNLACIKK